GGIRTHGTREGPPIFKTGPFNHSGTPPAPGRRLALLAGDHRRRAERVQHLRHAYRAVVLLVVLGDRDDRAADRDRRPVQGWDVAGAAALGGPVPAVEAAGLVVGRVRARRDLAVAAAGVARKPRLDVVLLRGRVAQLRDTDVDDAVGDLKRLEDLLLDGEQA